jgi:hypothetical protein
MADVFWDDYVQKVFILEQAIGHKVNYRILEPFHVSNTIVGIQAAAKKIAEFVSLDEYLFIVAVTNLTEEAAHVELEHRNREVFIEVSERLVNESGPAILAVLSHEICHKFLHHHSLNITEKHRQYENEVLTDITAVYLGLGKLMLNGCQYKEVNERYGVRETIKHTLGYLSGAQLAAVYNLVCNMRNIDRNTLEMHLRDTALATVRAVAKEFKSIYDDSFHQPDFSEQVTRKIQRSVRGTQDALTRAGAMIDFLQAQILQPNELAVRHAHQKIFNILKACSKKQDIEYNPALRYLRNLKADMEYGSTLEELAAMRDTGADVFGTIMLMLRSYPEKEQTFTEERRIKLQCPLDGTVIEFQAASGEELVSCPTCRYSFPILNIEEEIINALKRNDVERKAGWGKTWFEKKKNRRG